MRDKSVGALRDWEEGLEEVCVAEERMVVCLSMWVRARVRAPAMEAVGVVVSESGEVVDMRRVREARRVSSISRNGRYLLASSNEGDSGFPGCASLASAISTSSFAWRAVPFVERCGGVWVRDGYKSSARSVWLAIMATWLA